MSFLDAAETVLRQHANDKPLHYKRITDIAIEKGLISSEGLTPDSTMVAVISSEIKKRAAKGTPQRFHAYGKGLYGLESSSDPAQAAVAKQNLSIRKRLREALAEMDPKVFEQLIGRLLVAIGFEDVEVTRYSADGGIDVRGRLAVGGVTNVLTAIQVKRWANNVPDKTVRELRGGLSTQERGLIITLSDFTGPARVEADKSDPVPISLLNGEQLIDLLVENEIGVSVRRVNVLELDEETLDPPGDGGDAGGSGAGQGEKVLAIWPLPGGTRAWVQSLRVMLEKVSAAQPTLTSAIGWMKEHFESVNSDKSARSYWGVPRSMGLIETSGERLLLTQLGAEYLNEGSDAWLLQRLKESIVGIEELLDRVEQGAATEEELLEHLRQTTGVSWETTVQLQYRLRWLRNLGAVDYADGLWSIAAQPSGVLDEGTDPVRGGGPPGAYALDHHTSKMDPAIRRLFDKLREHILGLGEDVSERFMNQFVGYQRQKNFTEIVGLKGSLNVFIDGPVDDAEGVGQDVSNIGHWGTGSLRVKVASEEDVEKVIPLIDQAYKLQE